MLNQARLSAQAVTDCLAHARTRVTGDLLATVNAQQQDWDGVQMRHIFTQTMTLWRRYGRFDIILTANGKLAGFVDHDKYAEPGSEPLAQANAEALIRQAGVVPTDAVMESYQAAIPPDGESRTWKAMFALKVPEKEYTLLEVEVNAAKRAVIAVRPRRREGFHV